MLLPGTQIYLFTVTTGFSDQDKEERNLPNQPKIRPEITQIPSFQFPTEVPEFICDEQLRECIVGYGGTS